MKRKREDHHEELNDAGTKKRKLDEEIQPTQVAPEGSEEVVQTQPAIEEPESSTKPLQTEEEVLELPVLPVEEKKQEEEKPAELPLQTQDATELPPQEVQEEGKQAEEETKQQPVRGDISTLVKKHVNMDHLIFANSDIVNDVLRLIEEENAGFELGPRKDPIPIQDGEVPSTFQCVFWSQVWQHWVGVHQHGDHYLFSFDATQDGGLRCAQKLNALCEAEGAAHANKDLGTCPLEQDEWAPTAFKQVYHHQLSGFYASIYRGIQASSRNHDAAFIASRLNARCKKNNKEMPNEGIPLEFEGTEYKSVYLVPSATNPNLKEWVGEVKDAEGQGVYCKVASSARSCAIKLNWECLKMNWEQPNGDVGTEEPELVPTQFLNVFKDSINGVYVGMYPDYQIEISTPIGARECACLINEQCELKGIPPLHPGLPKLNPDGTAPVVKKAPVVNMYLRLLGRDKKQNPTPVPFRHSNAFGDSGPFFEKTVPSTRKSRIRSSLPASVSGYPYSSQYKRPSNRGSRRAAPNAERKKSRFKGVYWETRDQKWRARIYFGGKRLSAGSHTEELEAARAVNRLCRQLRMPVKNPEADTDMSIKSENWEALPQDVLGFQQAPAAPKRYRGRRNNRGRTQNRPPAQQAPLVKREQQPEDFASYGLGMNVPADPLALMQPPQVVDISMTEAQAPQPLTTDLPVDDLVPYV